jgi:hypothetical protein
MRLRELDPPRSFWTVIVAPDDEADLHYIADRISNLAGVELVMIQERRVTAVWQEGDDDGGGGGGGGGEGA